jgi:serine protease AprX
MRVERDWLRKLVFEWSTTRRFTQDSPILPEVWLSGGVAYCRGPDVRVDLLLTPHKDQTAGILARAILDGLEAEFATPSLAPTGSAYGPLGRSDDAPLTKPTWTVSVNQTTVAASLTLEELFTCALPLSPWWQHVIEPTPRQSTATKRDRAQREDEIAWMRRLVGVIALCARRATGPPARRAADNLDPWVTTQMAHRAEGATVADHEAFCEVVADEAGQRRIFERWVAEAKRWSARRITKRGDPREAPSLWMVGLNRQSVAAITRSVPATKSDAARRVFDIKCNDLAWAVIDSGIDARHQAFQVAAPSGNGAVSRVRGTYDFTRLRPLLSLDSHPTTGPSKPLPGVDLEDADRRFKQMRQRLRSGQSLDWAQLEPLIDMSLGKTNAYAPPAHDHGTHVAGIIGACDEAEQYYGVCRDISLYDLRVLDAEGRGEEFAIIAALQFIRFLNARADQPIIHGVNLSLSLLHDVENFACGRTPICDECDRLVASGVVVVAAAGNRGYERVLTSAGELEAYRAISITDPGNAESVITVGATHRFQPHTYGVSYFSSRGPTGDGRTKPDLLGPGERVYSTLPGNAYGAKDGTSMAAPHISGVAALLMARHREFVSQPARVKRILVESATDLGRERYFQGAGMVDALRALQAV